MRRVFIAGGAGFIGSHVAERLLQAPDTTVVVYDNLASGSLDRLASITATGRLEIVQADLKDAERVNAAVAGCEHAYHFAANPDIARAVTEPAVDFWEGTYLTHNLLEACRQAGVARLTYASGSGVYGDLGVEPVTESFGPLIPVSTYGASKLGCEALIASYCHMFDMSARAFRFANVVGPRQTHGVTYDFVRRLIDGPSRLRILGDGTQSKSYIHVSDVVSAMTLIAAQPWEGFDLFNVGTLDYVTVTEIADLAVESLGLDGVEYEYTGGSRGWKGDVPVVRFDTEKIRSHGWANAYTSREALLDSIRSNVAEAAAEPAGRPL
jgi:UDP-glucose 4-epimerase